MLSASGLSTLLTNLLVLTGPDNNQVPADWMMSNCACAPTFQHYCPYFTTETPFSLPVPCGLCVGRKVYVSGVIHSDPDRVTMSLLTTPNFGPGTSVALTYDNRFTAEPKPGHATVFNNFQTGKWGTELRTQIPFTGKEESFETTIEVMHDGYQVTLNGDQLAYFKGPSNKGPIYLKVVGDFSVKRVCFN